MKHQLCLILAALFILMSLAACSDSGKTSDETTAPSEIAIEENVGHPLYVRTDKNVESVKATFAAFDSDKTHSRDMKKIEDEDDAAIFICYEDTGVYNCVTLTIDDRDSDLLAFNNYVSGWDMSDWGEKPFTYGHDIEKPKYERKQFPYQERTKDILIWTPTDYDAKSAEKYSVIYMTDGHNLFEPTATSYGSWAVAESVEAMTSNTAANKTIIVGIENMDGWRDDELTPNLGTPTSEGYEDGHGAYFCDFVVKTVMPYIEENYNVYTDRDHTAICGSSSGGIESFYIAMEHSEKFGTVGALSPAFALFDDETWDKYLSKKDFSAGYPRVYIYCGEGNDLEQWLLPGAQSMPVNLGKINYPAENIYYYTSKKALHNEIYWRIIFPDFLRYLYS